MAWTFCLSGSAIVKAGANANSDIVLAGAILDEWSDEVEGAICTITRKDWVADYASITANFKPILADLASDLIAMKMVNYDPGGYTKPQLILDVLKDNVERNLKSLKDKSDQEVMD